jgi:hypothetical protein
MARFQWRRNTAAGAASNNAVLAAGEPGVTTDTHVLKVGDGATAWVDLPEVGSLTYGRKTDVEAAVLERADRFYVDAVTTRRAPAKFAVLSASGGTATFTFSGLPTLALYAVGVEYRVRFLIRDTYSTGRTTAEISFAVVREGGASGIYTGSIANTIGTSFGVGTGTYQISGATCAVNGSSFSFVLTNTSGNQIAAQVLCSYFPVNAVDVDGYVALGDSLTANGSPQWTATLSTSTGLQVTNLGVGGESSTQVAARIGAIPTTVNITGGKIPASGAVACATSTGVVTSLGSGITCWIAGVYGTLSYSAGAQSFTRATAGPPVSVADGATVIFEAASQMRRRTQIIWVGTAADGPTWNTTESNIAAIAARCATNKSLVISPFTTSADVTGTARHAALTALNASLAATYGSYFWDLRSYLITSGLSALSITPTGQDTTDVANDVIPASLRVDSTHLTQAAIGLVATQLYAKLQAVGLA